MAKSTQKRRIFFLRVVLFGVLVFGITSAAVLAGAAYRYRNVFYPDVRVGGLKLGGKSRAEGEQLILAQVNTYAQHPVRITLPDISQPRDPATNRYPEIEIPSTASQLGLQFAVQEAVEAAWETGHQSSLGPWLTSSLRTFFRGQRQAIPYHIDQEKIDAFIHTEIVPKITNPVPAKVVVQGGEVKVEPGAPGLEVDVGQLSKDVAASLESFRDQDTTYIRAPVKEVDSPISLRVVQPLAEKWQALGGVKLTLSAQEAGNFTPRRDQMLGFFTTIQNESGEISLAVDEEAVSKYVIATKKIDSKKSLASITKALGTLLSGDLATTAPDNRLSLAVVAKVSDDLVTPGAYTLGKFEGKYIEVNLKEQKLYMINGSTLEKTFRVSTGKWSTPTPQGIFKIANKNKRAYSSTYKLYMPYWQNFVALDANSGPQIDPGDYGLHELPEWPNGYKEGQNHLGTPVSHGCIRLGIGPAEEVFNWTSVGTPIYVH